MRLTLFLMLFVAVSTTLAADPGDPGRNVGAEQLTADQIQRRAAAVHDRASRALVRVEHESGTLLPGTAGVIVTANGYVVHRAISGGGKKTFHLSDGRRVIASLLGWSKEWGVGLAKLNGPGPWPHVELADSAGVKAGQCVVTLGYAGTEAPDLFPQPLLNVDGVAGSAVGRWFVVRDHKITPGRNAPAAFDLDGRLVGLGWIVYTSGVLGTVYTDAKVIRSIWNDLTAGKNVDELRLRGANPQEDKVSPLMRVATREVEEKTKAASVRIRKDPKDKYNWISGTIVSADGLVATCAHGFAFVTPGTKVTVYLPDGRNAAGEVVGYNHVCDIALLRITDRGPWPHVEMGDSTRMRPGDPCLFAGYGPRNPLDRQPNMRRSSVPVPDTPNWDPRLELDPKTRLVGGDSGGGVFDADGRLVAMFVEISGGDNLHNRSMRIELLRNHWAELRKPYEQSATFPQDVAEAKHRRAGERTRESVVNVLDGMKVIAHGIVVGRNGRILTLASPLPETPSCRLPDGRILPATVVKTSREHNLAELRIEAGGLATLEWSQADNLPVGTLVAMLTDSGQTATGFISHPTVSIPPETSERGLLWAHLRDSERGPQVSEVVQALGAPRSPFQKGDIIVSVDGHPTPNLEAYQKLWREKGAPTVGDPVPVVLIRQGKKIHFRYVCGPPGWPRPDGQTPRCSGFASVYSVAVNSQFGLGGPVVDSAGKAIGIAIAWRARGRLLVLPAASLKAAIGDQNLCPGARRLPTLVRWTDRACSVIATRRSFLHSRDESTHEPDFVVQDSWHPLACES